MLCLYSSATQVIEWQAPPQNSLLPVAFTITCVAMTPPAPITMPAMTSASSGQRALGLDSQRQDRATRPRPAGCAAAVMSRSGSLFDLRPWAPSHRQYPFDERLQIVVARLHRGMVLAAFQLRHQHRLRIALAFVLC